VSGTAGAADSLAKWNSDGDLVEGPAVIDDDSFTSATSGNLATAESIKNYVDGATGSGSSVFTLLGTMDTATGTPTTVSLVSLDLTELNWLRLVWDGVEGSVSTYFLVEGDRALYASITSDPIYAFTDIDLNSGIMISHHSSGDTSDSGLSSASTSISVSVSSGTFAGGEIKVYGRA